MSIVECPNCGTSWLVPTRYQGKRLGCHWCRTMFYNPISVKGSIGIALLLSVGSIVFLAGLLWLWCAVNMNIMINTHTVYGTIPDFELIEAKRIQMSLSILTTGAGGMMFLVGLALKLMRL